MLQQMWWMRRSVACVVKCGAVANTKPYHHHHHHHHHYCTTTKATKEVERQATENHNNTTTTTTTTKSYNPATYKLPFTSSEADTIMAIINSATLQHLASLGVGKGVAARLKRHIHRFGALKHLSQLLEVDGLGIKKTEDVCRSLLQWGSSLEDGVEGLQAGEGSGLQGLLAEDLVVSVDPKRLVKPLLREEVLLALDNFVALHVTAGFLSWVMCGADGSIQGLATHQLLSANSRFNAIKVYEKVLSVVRQIPKADYYVWEERAGHAQLAKAPLASVIVALQLAQIRGMLMALLGGIQEEEEELRYDNHCRLLFLKDSVVPRLFKLKMGSDRVSGLGVADRVMGGQLAVDWLPPLSVPADVTQTYFNEPAGERRYAAAAVLVGVAFREVVLARNSAALKVLSL